MSEIIYFALTAIGTLVIVWGATHQKWAKLPRWDISVHHFLVLVSTTLGGAILVPQLGTAIVRSFVSVDQQLDTIVRQAFYEIGSVVGIFVGLALVGRSLVDNVRLLDIMKRAPFAGLLTFLASLPLTAVAGKLSENILAWMGIPVERQSQFDLLATAKSPARPIAWSIIAIVAAPITEELVFRAGLFRYIRGRVPRWAALTLPSAVFAAFHTDLRSVKGLAALAPLFVLGILWSLAYERSGTIFVSIIAHCLTNLAAIGVFAVTK